MSRNRADLTAASVAVGLIGAAAVVGAVLHLSGRPPGASAAPVYAHWRPHVGPGTPLALAVAVVVVRYGPGLAARLPWSRLLPAAVAASGGWILSLALIDGWQRGVAGRLTTRHEYLAEVGAVGDVSAFLRGFTDRILDFQPDSWATHVAGHPPGALLVFVWLDRIGLGGGAWAVIACVVAGASVAASVPWTVRVLGSPDGGDAGARAAVPFAVLLPGAVWLGVSADALFAGAAAAGIALLATALRRRHTPVAPAEHVDDHHRMSSRARPSTAAGAVPVALAGGAVLAFCGYLSYGLVLMLPLVLAVVLAAGRVRPMWWAVAGGAAVAVAFTVAGFWWLDGYHLTVRRYYQGLASERPVAYWMWANLALAVLSGGPAAAAILRRAVAAAVSARPWRWRALRSAPRPLLLRPVVLLPLAACAAMAAADLSGLSKAEVERIWLPFMVWLPAGAALLPASAHRWWLAAQAATALLVNHLLLTTW